MIRWRIGLDVGSTPVKAVAVDARSGEVVRKEYQRHETRHAEKTVEILAAIEEGRIGSWSRCRRPIRIAPNIPP